MPTSAGFTPTPPPPASPPTPTPTPPPPWGPGTPSRRPPPPPPARTTAAGPVDRQARHMHHRQPGLQQLRPQQASDPAQDVDSGNRRGAPGTGARPGRRARRPHAQPVGAENPVT